MVLGSSRLGSSLVSVSLISLLTIFASSCGSSNDGSNVSGTQNVLVAQYTVKQAGATDTWVEFGPDINYGRRTSKTAPEGDSTTVLVAGMKAQTTYHMRAHATLKSGGEWVDQDRTFTTGEVPSPQTISAAVTRPTAKASQQGVEFLNLSDTSTSALGQAAVDLDGNLIWYYNPPTGDSATVSRLMDNGHIMLDIQNSDATVFTVREVDLAGSTIREVSSTSIEQQLQSLLGRAITFYQFHHDVLPLPNGHTIVLANTKVPYLDLPGYPGTTNVIGDLLIDLDENGVPVWFWSTFDHLDINRHLQGLPDWTHSNCIVYTAEDGNLLLSMRHQSWVIKIDYANGTGSGDILWRLGNEGDFTLTGGDPSNWFYAQHFPNLITQNGSQMTLTVVDNGNYRVLDSSGDTCGTTTPCYSRAVIVNLDEVTKTATVAWQDPQQYYSFWGGSSGIVDGSNVEFDMTAPFPAANPPYFQPASQVQEVTQDGSNTLIWQLNISGANAYRAYRIPSLYPGVTWDK